MCFLCIGIIGFIILIIIEFGAFKMLKQLIFNKITRNYPTYGPQTVDDDVLVENKRINQMTENDLKRETLVMQNASKFYGKFCAVNKFSVSIKK